MDKTIKKNERADKPLFYAMVSVFFLLFALAPAYWAIYNYGEYSRTAAFVEELKLKSEPILTANERQERERLIASNSSTAERRLLEMSLSAAGSFVLFLIALILIVKALKARGDKTEYEPLAQNAFAVPQNRIEVKYKTTYSVLFVLIAAFFTAMALLVSYQTLNSRFESPNGKIIKGIVFPFCLLFVPAFVGYLQIRAKRQAVKLIDSTGILRGDGRLFSWNEFRGTITQVNFNRRTLRKYVWRVELVFAGNQTAWLIPNRVKNYEEVFNYVDYLPPAVPKNQ